MNTPSLAWLSICLAAAHAMHYLLGCGLRYALSDPWIRHQTHLKQAGHISGPVRIQLPISLLLRT